MRQINSLSHRKWECKYHIVFIPEYRRKALFGQIRRDLPAVFHQLAGQKESLWARGYFASTVGRDEQVIREYIGHQEKEDRRVDQLKLM